MFLLKKIKVLLKNINLENSEYFLMDDVNPLSLEPQIIYKYKIKVINNNMIIHLKIDTYILKIPNDDYIRYKCITNDYIFMENYLKKIS